jgi:hypothetical protein
VAAFAAAFRTMRGPKCCSMEMTRAVRDHAATLAERDNAQLATR